MGLLKGKRAVWLGLILLVGLMAGNLNTRNVFAVSDITYDKLKVFIEVYAHIKKKYVETVDEKKVLYGAIRGMLQSLDPHSYFLDPDAYKEMKVDTRGEFGGLGITVTRKDGAIKVISPVEDTPAYRAGIKPSDLIVKIDDEITKDMSLMEAVKRMRGKPGTDIKLTIIRKGENKPLYFTLTRAIIEIKTVKWRLEEGNIGYVRITQFSEKSYLLLAEALTSFDEELGDDRTLQGLVLDLRNNPGGLLDQAIRISDAFLNKGRIVYTKGRLEGKDLSMDATDGDLVDGAPIVILINGGSASASEIVAGALQDHKRAIVMGTQSFGKGSVQTIIPLSDGSALRLTTSKYYIPSGRSIQAKGIVPDIIVEDMLLSSKKNIRHLTKEIDIKGHLENGDEKSDKAKEKKKPAVNTDDKERKDKADEADKTEAEGDKKVKADEVTGRSKNDYQLKRALDLLRGYNIFSRMQTAEVQTPAK